MEKDWTNAILGILLFLIAAAISYIVIHIFGVLISIIAYVVMAYYFSTALPKLFGSKMPATAGLVTTILSLIIPGIIIIFYGDIVKIIVFFLLLYIIFKWLLRAYAKDVAIELEKMWKSM